MSLITLNSNGQLPHFYNCHFPQAIKIKPNSQVCILKFLHFRDSSVFNITASNNKLVFLIGNSRQDAYRIVNIPIGQYTGSELATTLATEMNNVLQQQNYAWVVAYTNKADWWCFFYATCFFRCSYLRWSSSRTKGHIFR